LTAAGVEALEEWVAVMRERARLIETFLETATRTAGDAAREAIEGREPCTP
jgi:hypothetical protein